MRRAPHAGRRSEGPRARTNLFRDAKPATPAAEIGAGHWVNKLGLKDLRHPGEALLHAANLGYAGAGGYRALTDHVETFAGVLFGQLEFAKLGAPGQTCPAAPGEKRSLICTARPTTAIGAKDAGSQGAGIAGNDG